MLGRIHCQRWLWFLMLCLVSPYWAACQSILGTCLQWWYGQIGRILCRGMVSKVKQIAIAELAQSGKSETRRPNVGCKRCNVPWVNHQRTRGLSPHAGCGKQIIPWNYHWRPLRKNSSYRLRNIAVSLSPTGHRKLSKLWVNHWRPQREDYSVDEILLRTNRTLGRCTIVQINLCRI